MNGYLDDALLTLSLIGAPVILGTLLYYGLTISSRPHHEQDEKQGFDVRTKPDRASNDAAGRIQRRPHAVP